MSAMSRQFVLELGHAESHAREDFVAGAPNAAALSLIDGWPDWTSRAMVVVGPPASGKSHLASIWAAKAGAEMIDGAGFGDEHARAMQGVGAVVVDGLSPGAFDERALFHALNLVRQNGVWLLVAARTPPAGWAVDLPDLKSRLRALPCVDMGAPDDALLRALLIKLAADRQQQLDPAVINYLLLRIERSFAGVRAAIEKLDKGALQLQRPVTRALAAELFRDEAP